MKLYLWRCLLCLLSNTLSKAACKVLVQHLVYATHAGIQSQQLRAWLSKHNIT